MKDDTVARQLGISLRTLQRRLSEIFDGMDARTRFQAGYRVAERRMLDDRTVTQRAGTPGSPPAPRSSPRRRGQ